MSSWKTAPRPGRASHHPPRRLSIELLEPRHCLALTVPALSSLPGAAQTIYLDFNGHYTYSTVWNTSYSSALISSPAYSSDADANNFSTAELTAIQNAWQRVAEDFRPFNVNVTTVEPASGDLVRSGASDTRWGVRVVITKDTAFRCGCGGIAYIDSFNWSSDTPVFVFNTSEIGLAEAISHEVGHSLGLAHDGDATSSYYDGHGTGATSWAPIMGVGYYSNVTQWDNGTFTGATNRGSSANYNKGPDDLAIITSYNGFGYRADDYGDTLATATDLTVNGQNLSASGLIGRTADVDVFRFTSAAGAVSFQATPATLGANLDIKLELLDAVGQVLATADPTTSLNATLTANVAAGTYYLRVDGTGVGNPQAASPTGYSDYGSLGAYSITGSAIGGTADSLAISAASASLSEGATGSTPFTFTVARTGDTSTTTTVLYRVSGSGTSAATAADFVGGQFPASSLTFLPTETSKTITINVQGDTATESNETFQVTLSQPSGLTRITQASAVGTILNDDVAPGPPKFNIAANSASRNEGTGSAATPFTFTITRTGDASGTASVYYSVQGIGSSPVNYADFPGYLTPTFVSVRFAAGQTTADISVPIVADNVKENNESFRVTLQFPSGATLGVSTADGFVINDDGVAAIGTLAPDLAATGMFLGAQTLIAVADPLDAFVEVEHEEELGHTHEGTIEMVFSVAGTGESSGIDSPFDDVASWALGQEPTFDGLPLASLPLVGRPSGDVVTGGLRWTTNRSSRGERWSERPGAVPAVSLVDGQEEATAPESWSAAARRWAERLASTALRQVRGTSLPSPFPRKFG